MTTATSPSSAQKKKGQSSVYDTPTEKFDTSALKNGYTAKEAYKLAHKWKLEKFLDITEVGAYSYTHLPEFMPQNLVRRDGQMAVLASAPNAAIGQVALEDDGGKMVSLEALSTEPGSPVQGIMVIHKGKIAYEIYPGMQRSDHHVWMSNTKIIAGLLISQLDEEGKLDMQHGVGEYLPAAKGTAWEDIKIIDIMNMQSGLDLEENPATRKGNTPYGNFVRAEVGQKGFDGKVHTHNEMLLAIPKKHAPGKAFEYSSANTQMLGLIIEAVSNSRLADAISERAWMHAGMDGDALLGLSPQGNGIIHGLMSSRLIDMAKFGMLYTPSWNLVSDKPVVSKKIIKEIQTGGTRENFLKGTIGPRLVEDFRERPEFNSHQWDSVFADGDFFKSGMNNQGIYVSPSRDAVFVWFTSGFTRVPIEAYTRAVMKVLD